MPSSIAGAQQDWHVETGCVGKGLKTWFAPAVAVKLPPAYCFPGLATRVGGLEYPL